MRVHHPKGVLAARVEQVVHHPHDVDRSRCGPQRRRRRERRGAPAGRRREPDVRRGPAPPRRIGASAAVAEDRAPGRPYTRSRIPCGRWTWALRAGCPRHGRLAGNRPRYRPGAGRARAPAWRSALAPENARGRRGGRSARAVPHDTLDLDSAPSCSRPWSELGPVEILVTNTGGPPGGDPLEFTRDQWEAAHRERWSCRSSDRTVVPGMRERGFGRILSVSSSAAREPIPNLMLSNSHRPGLLAAFKTLARRSPETASPSTRSCPADRDRSPRSPLRHARRGERAPRDEVPRPARHPGGDRGGRRVPVLRTGELRHRRGAAGGRRPHEEHLSRCRRSQPPPPTPSHPEWPSRSSASSGPPRDRARAGRPLVRAARAPLPPADARCAGERRAAADARRPSSTSPGRPRTARTGWLPSPGGANPRTSTTPSSP